MPYSRVVIVSGASRGVGAAIARWLASAGSAVTLISHSEGALDDIAKEVQRLGGTPLAFKADISDAGACRAAVLKTLDRFGKLDALVNNAGITRDGLILRMNEEDWDAVLDINLKGVFLCTKEAVKIMVKQRRGKIINIASVVAFMGNSGQANYGASKAGIIGFTKTIAREYASRGITVNAVAPGFIQTAMTDALDEQVKQEMLKSIPAGTFGSVDDVAQAVVFLASAGSDYITGQVIHVNGGMYM